MAEDKCKRELNKLFSALLTDLLFLSLVPGLRCFASANHFESRGLKRYVTEINDHNGMGKAEQEQGKQSLYIETRETRSIYLVDHLMNHVALLAPG